MIEKFKVKYTIPPSNKIYVTCGYYFDEKGFREVHPIKHKFEGFTKMCKQFKT